MTISPSAGLGLLLLLPGVVAGALGGSVTVHNATVFLFMIVFLGVTMSYVVASRWCQSFRPLHRNGKLVLPLVVGLTLVCLGIAMLSYRINATMSLGQLLSEAL